MFGLCLVSINVVAYESVLSRTGTRLLKLSWLRAEIRLDHKSNRTLNSALDHLT